MDSGEALQVELCAGLSAVEPAAWNALANPDGAPFDPFLTWEFLEALEASGCATPEEGWAPAHLIARDCGAAVGAMPLYLKSHSYGEYVFDHAWADALMRAGGRYYPKAQCAIPFTPATGRRVLAPDERVRAMLVAGAIEVAKRMHASSLHVTFCTKGEQAELAHAGLLARAGLQFHWRNDGYGAFADFLASLSSQKRKAIRRERERALEGVRVRRVTGADIKESDWDFFFRCYMDTGSRKWGSPYLNREFFSLIGERMGDRIVLFIADCGSRPIASALNLLGSDTLYGRYWGRVEERPFLHFELCYYQAIDFAIEQRLARVEAGAQGEHKLSRGYVPVPTYSSHWIAHAGLREAVARYLASERPAIAEEIEFLGEHTPFKMSE
jgi:predicted N-acyltransferase